MVEMMETRLDREITMKGEQYSKGCEVIEERLTEHMIPVRANIDIILKARAR